jgi:hypothetical protein
MILMLQPGCFTRTIEASNLRIRAGRSWVGTRCGPTGRRCSRGYPIFHAQVLRSVPGGDTVWTEWHWAGTRSDGLPFEMRGLTLFEIAADHIVAGRLYMEEVEREMVDIGQTVEDLSGQRPDEVRPEGQLRRGR